jgi:hypothetical protein
MNGLGKGKNKVSGSRKGGGMKLNPVRIEMI